MHFEHFEGSIRNGFVTGLFLVMVAAAWGMLIRRSLLSAIRVFCICAFLLVGVGFGDEMTEVQSRPAAYCVGSTMVMAVYGFLAIAICGIAETIALRGRIKDLQQELGLKNREGGKEEV